MGLNDYQNVLNIDGDGFFFCDGIQPWWVNENLMQIIVNDFPLIPMIKSKKTDKIKLDHVTTNFFDDLAILRLHEFLQSPNRIYTLG